MIKENYSVDYITYDEIKQWCLYKHYAKRIPSVNYSFGLFDIKKILIGICTYGIPPSNDLMLCCGEKFKNIVIELNRVIKNDTTEKNLQSWFLAQTFKKLDKPKIIISYADPNFNHHGYIYQSLNFLYTGFGGGVFEYYYNQKQYHGRHINKTDFFDRLNLKYDNNKTINENFILYGGKVIKQQPKYRYILFLGNKKEKKEMLKNLKYKILSYPKGDNQRYDASYEPDIQMRLF